MTEKKLAVVVLSGGLDSCVTMADAIERGYETALLHVNYGQRTQNRELDAFNHIADYYNIGRRLIVDLSFLKQIGGSSLTDPSLPVEIDGVDKSRIPSTYVPFRNANILGVAVSWAEVIGAERVFIGAVEGDSSGYPDCTEVFYRKYNEMLEAALPLYVNIKIEAPLIHMSKADIVKKGVNLSAPLSHTWSCYQNEILACGVCDSCRLRKEAFRQAGVEDVIIYETD